jgi:hypothetical protein
VDVHAPVSERTVSNRHESPKEEKKKRNGEMLKKGKEEKGEWNGWRRGRGTYLQGRMWVWVMFVSLGPVIFSQFLRCGRVLW